MDMKIILPWSKYLFTWSLQRRILLWEWRTPSFHQVLRPPAPHLLLWCTSHDPPPPLNREIRTKIVAHKRNKAWNQKYNRHQFSNSLYLFADIIPGQVNNRAKAFQHVKDHLSVAALQGCRGQGQIIKKKSFPQITSHHRHLPTWKRGTLLTME